MPDQRCCHEVLEATLELQAHQASNANAPLDMRQVRRVRNQQTFIANVKLSSCWNLQLQHTRRAVVTVASRTTRSSAL